MVLSALGKIVEEEWNRSFELRPEFLPDSLIVLPNHLHAIVIRDDTGQSTAEEAGDLPQPRAPARGSLGAFVGGFKAAATRRINEIRGTPGQPVWQRNYFERVIRNAGEWEKIQCYIVENPARWAMDRENPAFHIHRGPAPRPPPFL